MLWLLGLRNAFSAIISFCSKPPGSWIAAACAACLGLWWFGHLKYAAGVAAATAAAAATQAKLKAKQDNAVKDAEAAALVRAIESAKLNSEARETVANVKEMSRNMPDSGGVAIAPDIADRLRSLH